MHPYLKPYAILVEFLGKALGSDYEIVLHDLTDDNASVAAIANGQISGRGTGAPLTNMALRFIADKEYLAHDYILGYRGMSQAKTQLCSSTMFIKSPEGELMGLLCINFDPTRCLQAANTMLSVCNLPPLSLPPEDSAAPSIGTETFVGSIPDAVRNAIEEVTGDAGIPSSRLTMDEKVRIVGALNQGGLFILKGSVSEVANQLGASEATIYRYLSKLKG